jgi:hypothetical protein
MGTQGYSKTFAAASSDRYLHKTLAAKGELVSSYFGVTRGELANEIAMISGQGPTPQTEAGCASYGQITPGTIISPDSQVSGQGCVYPEAAQTLISELVAKRYTWRAYVQGLGDVVNLPPAPNTSTTTTTTGSDATTTPGAVTTPGTATTPGAATPPGAATTSTATTPAAGAARAGRQPAAHQAIAQVGTVNAATCRHPAIGTPDVFQSTSHTDPYVTWRDPFVYFRSVTSAGTCNKDVVGLTRLAEDLKSAGTTPSVSFVYPDPCDDGTSDPCYSGAASGLAPADAFLRSIVPRIMKSAAYKQGGLILITFAQAPQTGSGADSDSCCDNPTTYPNLPVTSGSGDTTTPTTTTTTPTTTNGSNATGTTTAPYGIPDATSSCVPSGTSTTPTTTTGTTTTSGTGTATTPSTTAPCTAPAGGQVGLLAISEYVSPGTSDLTDSFNHFSLLGSIEQLFGLKPLGYAADKQLPLFGASFYTNYKPS